MPANERRRKGQAAGGLADLKRLHKAAVVASAAAAAAHRPVVGKPVDQKQASTAPLTREDVQLFLRAMKTVTPIKDTHRAILAASPSVPEGILRERRARAVGLDPVSLPQTSDIYTPAKMDADDSRYLCPGHGSDLIRGLKRGKWPVEATLDLHGSTLEQARERLDRFLASCLAHGIRCVRIVHGKGYGSKNAEPVLKQTVRRWLTQVASVMAFVECAEADGGTGAVQVLLK